MKTPVGRSKASNRQKWTFTFNRVNMTSSKEKQGVFRLLPCDPEGRLSDASLPMPEAFRAASEATASLYKQMGYTPPWIGYASIFDGQIVGGGAFVGSPVNGEVEIAYFTLDEHAGNGHASRTAGALVEIALSADPAVCVIAKTLPQKNSSTSILSRLGFVQSGVVQDEEVGEAWLWRRTPPAS